MNKKILTFGTVLILTGCAVISPYDPVADKQELANALGTSQSKIEFSASCYFAVVAAGAAAGHFSAGVFAQMRHSLYLVDKNSFTGKLSPRLTIDPKALKYLAVRPLYETESAPRSADTMLANQELTQLQVYLPDGLTLQNLVAINFMGSNGGVAAQTAYRFLQAENVTDATAEQPVVRDPPPPIDDNLFRYSGYTFIQHEKDRADAKGIKCERHIRDNQNMPRTFHFTPKPIDFQTIINRSPGPALPTHGFFRR